MGDKWCGDTVPLQEGEGGGSGEWRVGEGAHREWVKEEATHSTGTFMRCPRDSRSDSSTKDAGFSAEDLRTWAKRERERVKG